MYRVIICAIIVYLIHQTYGQAGGISSKLDFGKSDSTTHDYESTLSTSLVKALVSLRQSSGVSKTLISSKVDDNPFNLRNVAPLARNTDIKDDFSNIGFVCVDGKCNTTEEKSKTGDKISTDVLVQVVTNVKDDMNKNKSIVAGDDDDIPVVVGYSGTNIKNSDFDLTNRRIDESGDVKIVTSDNNDKNYNFYQSGNEVRPVDHSYHQVPHFNPNFNTHYFGETAPPQFVWYRRRNGYGNSHNPHAFRTNRPYKPFQWHLKYPTATITPPGWTTTTQCSCSNPGLNWYPSFGPNQPSPKPPVNDKIAPLN